MPEDQELGQAAGKIAEAKNAAEEEKRSRPFSGGEDETTAPEPAHQDADEGFSPT